MKKIAVANIKGGCGKTTIATNLACIAAGKGSKVVIIDADTQGSSMKFRAMRPDNAPTLQAVSILTNTIHKDINSFSADYVFIDVGGRDSDLFRSALMAVDAIIIPVTPSQYDIWSSEDTLKVVQEVRETYSEIRNIKAGICLNQVILGTTLSQDVQTLIAEYISNFNLHYFKTSLGSRVAYKESVSEGLSVCEIKGEKFLRASDEMSELYKEVIEWA